MRGCCGVRRVADRRAVLESLESRQLLAGDLVAHWQADDLTATVGDGEQVDRWQDRVSQIPADRVDGSVELAANRLGGRAVLRFDAADGGDSLAVHKTVNPMAGAEDFSIVLAFATSTTDLSGGQSDWFRNTGLVDSSQLGLHAGLGNQPESGGPGWGRVGT